MGGWLVWLAAEPWASSMMAVEQAERNGSRFYHTNPRTDVLYDEIGRAVRALRRGRPDEALPVIEACSKADSSNPLFDFMKATALWDEGKHKEATDAVFAGSAKPGIWLYATSHRNPSEWQWNEIELIRGCARKMVDCRPADKRRFVAAIMMGDRIIWSEPPSMIRIQQGISARRAGAYYLKELALGLGDQRLANMCAELIREGRKFSFGINRKLSRERSSTGTRAWALQRMLKERDRYAIAVSILQLDEQAQWTKECRDEYMTRGLADRVAAASERL